MFSCRYFIDLSKYLYLTFHPNGGPKQITTLFSRPLLYPHNNGGWTGWPWRYLSALRFYKQAPCEVVQSGRVWLVKIMLVRQSNFYATPGLTGINTVALDWQVFLIFGMGGCIRYRYGQSWESSATHVVKSCLHWRHCHFKESGPLQMIPEFFLKNHCLPIHIFFLKKYCFMEYTWMFLITQHPHFCDNAKAG